MLRMTQRKLMANYAAQQGRKGGILFTPGPLSTSRTVREAQMEDYGSRDSFFVDAVKEVRTGLLDIACVGEKEWSAIPMQGSGTMGIEAVINSVTPRENAKHIVICNGSYGQRMVAVLKKLKIPVVPFEVKEGEEVDLIAFQQLLMTEKDVTNIGFVHCETSTGMFNPIHGLAALSRRAHPKATIFVDAMSSFGGVEFAAPDVCDVLVTSANKCIQGVPGFSIVIAKNELLERCRGWSPSFTLDIAMQRDGLDKTGQFSYTPPVQSLIAFRQALREHKEEGGTNARAARYKSLCDRIADDMTSLGFSLFLDRTKPSFGHIITSYNSPQHPKWDFTKFYNLLADDGFVIYPGKASQADTFRIGSIGDLHMPDVEALMTDVKVVLEKMDVNLK